MNLKQGQMNLVSIDVRGATFRTAETVQNEIRAACEAHPQVAHFHELGESEAGRPVYGVVLGCGKRKVSLIAGAHSDEPVGPETLRILLSACLADPVSFAELLREFTFIIVPHINPDGEARNQAWIRDWPDAESYLRHAFRELPGRDLEFGFPEMRQENRLVSKLLQVHAPLDLHLSLHGMGFSDGVMLLIEKHWIARSLPIQDGFANLARASSLALHDNDRKGEKGFQYIAPGFTTTPEGRAMRAHFEAIGDTDTAAQFHDSSMEFVRSLGGDPLCLVTELPLFLINRKAPTSEPGVPQAYLDFKARVPALRSILMRGESLKGELEEFGISPFPLEQQIQLQLSVIQLGLEAVRSCIAE